MTAAPRSKSPVARASRPCSSRSGKSALAIFRALPDSKKRCKPADMFDVERVLILLERRSADGYGVRIAPLNYLARVLTLSEERITGLLQLVERWGCLRYVLVQVPIVPITNTLPSLGAYVISVDGVGPLIWFPGHIARTLQLAHEGCFAPETVEPIST